MKFRKLTLSLAVALMAGSALPVWSANLDNVSAADLLKLLVDEGVINADAVKKLEAKLTADASKKATAAVDVVSPQNRDVQPQVAAGVVRVPYIPEYVRNQIRDEVRAGLREDVSQDVMAQAKQQQWGVPSALPSWISNIKFASDIRLRYQNETFGSENLADVYTRPEVVNGYGNDITPYYKANTYPNVTEDRDRSRVRLRFGVTNKINDTWNMGLQLVTGNEFDPVSTNQTLGNYGDKYQTNFDLAYLNYTNIEKTFTSSGGRFKNPFLYTDLIWDNDLTFQGIYGTYHFMRSDNQMEFGEENNIDPFITAGAFPLQEIDNSSNDKMLYAAQAGFTYNWINQNVFEMGLAYYQYENIQGERYEVPLQDFNDSRDYTEPQFVQKGNSLFNIIYDPLDPSKLGLGIAPGFKIVDLTAKYDIAQLAPYHIYLTADWLKNIGWDDFNKDEVYAGLDKSAFDEQSDAYLLQVAFGWPRVERLGAWQVALGYRYLERDSVLDAYADSDFHLGGTDAEGYTFKLDYGLADNVWATFRYMSSNEIDGRLIGNTDVIVGRPANSSPLSVDTIQLDLNAKF
jgi:hypothetical protein